MHLLFSLFLLTASPAVETDTVSVHADLPPVSVVATRVGVLPAEAPARVTILGSQQIADTGSRSVADLLEARSSLFVRRYGPAGLASISFRGTGASQTLVLLDGHRIADPQLGQLDLSLLPTILLERVEIMHGAGSALHGTDGLGGVVDLRSLRPETTGFTTALATGAFGERDVNARATFAGERLRAVVAAEYAISEGNFPYFNPNLGLTGEWVRRTGADRSQLSVFARAEAEFDRSTAFAAVWTGAAERGVPGSVGSPTQARQEDTHLRIWGGNTTRLSWGTLRAGGLVQRASLRYNDDEGNTLIGSAEIEARIPAGRWLVAAGASAGAGHAEHPNLDADARETRLGSFISATGDYGLLLLYPALRADAYLRNEGDALTAVSPRLGLNVQPVERLPVRLKAGAGSAFRAPTFNDRFWRYGGSGLGGDPHLRPERSWTVDAGAMVSAGVIQGEVTAYASATSDQITWLPGTSGLYMPINIGRTRTLGLEASAEVTRLKLGPITVGGGITAALTDARDRTDPGSQSYDRPLRLVPRHTLKTHLTASASLDGRTAATLSLGAQHVGERPVTADASIVEPPYTVADAHVRVSRSLDRATASLALGIDNVLDRSYAVLRGYPMPPRHARLRLGLSL